MSKLTLHVPDRLVAAAKLEAANRKTSVSKMVSDYFRAFDARSSGGSAVALPPVTSSLVGCIRGAKGDRESYVDYLERKHK
jgi:hypothetical protein